MAVPVTGTIEPTDPSTDTYPVIDPIYGIDGLRCVANAAARDAIPTPRRRLGMFVILQSDLTAWQLNTATNTGTDADWTQFTAGAAADRGDRTYAWVTGRARNVCGRDGHQPMGDLLRRGTLTRWDIVAKTGPVGAALIVDVVL